MSILMIWIRFCCDESGSGERFIERKRFGPLVNPLSIMALQQKCPHAQVLDLKKSREEFNRGVIGHAKLQDRLYFCAWMEHKICHARKKFYWESQVSV